MKILLINHFPLTGSGSGVYNANIASSLMRKGHEVRIIMPENIKIDGDIIHPVYFKDKDGKYTKEMTKINYAINMARTDRNVGPAILNCYRSGNHLKTIEPFVLKATRATIEEQPTENGSKYVITKIADKEL